MKLEIELDVKTLENLIVLLKLENLGKFPEEEKTLEQYGKEIFAAAVNDAIKQRTYDFPRRV